MKKILFTFTMLVVALGASSVLAANTNWEGKYWGDHEGIWAGTLFDDPTGPDKPHFEGKWASADEADYGKLFADLKYEGHGIYKVVKGVVYDEKGYLIGTWDGYFDVNYKPGRAEGTWAEIDATSTQQGKWQGKRILP